MPPKRTPDAPDAPDAKTRQYHHGDLKRALVEAATSILRTDGLDALTLRAVARQVGVSQAAPYRHFRDRRELVAAVAEEGFRRLGTAMSTAAASSEGREGFRRVALAYVEFAHANAAEYRVMFGAEVAHHDDLPELGKSAKQVLSFVTSAITALQHAGAVRAGDAQMMAVALWSTLHGLVMLSLDGQTQDLPLDQLVSESMRTVMMGLAPR